MAAGSLSATNLPQGTIEEVAAEWSRRVSAADERIPARSLYQGRSFREAEGAAAAAGARFGILSAGLGLLDADALVPAYSLTVLPQSGDDVLAKLPAGTSAASWWAQLRLAGLGSDLAEFVSNDRGLVLIAAGRTYLEMIGLEAAALDPIALQRVRIFTAARVDKIPAALRGFVMPYDARLDGPDSERAGTRSDFAPRALRHFAEKILPGSAGASPLDHRAVVDGQLAPWAWPRRGRGTSRSDPELRALIAEQMRAARGRSSTMLRILRDDLGIACEQGRFRRLFAEVGEGGLAR